MSDAPERIWYNGTTQHARELRWQAPTSDLHPQHEYVRADLHEAIRAENDRLDRACVEWAEVWQTNYQRVESLQAENERLREALNLLTDILDQCTFRRIFLNGQYLTRREAVAKARAALETKKAPGDEAEGQ